MVAVPSLFVVNRRLKSRADLAFQRFLSVSSAFVGDALRDTEAA
jgi:hypothetical protein